MVEFVMEYLPVIIVAAIIGAFALAFIFAWIALRKHKEEGDDRERNVPDSVIIKRLAHYAIPHWKSFIGIFFIMLFSIIYDLLSPLLVGDIQNLIKDKFALEDLFLRVGIYAGILVVSLICTYLQAMILQKIGQKILSQIRLDVFTHIESLSHEQLNNIPVGKLVTRVTNDPNRISFMFTNILVTLIKNSMVIVGVLGAMLVLNYALTLMVLCFVPFVVLFTVIFRQFSRRVHRQVSNATTDINTYLSENLSGMKITQIFNQEGQKLDDFMARSQKLKKAKQNRMFVFGIFRPMVYMLFVGSQLCLFYFGAKGHIQNTEFLGQVIDSATVVSFYMFISRFFNPIQTLAEQFDMLQQSFAGAEKIFSILDLVPEVVDEPDAIELDEIKGEIEFKDVWFAYKPDEWVLKGVSFHISPKQTVAFVGSTGSGKTTILSLICRNYDIQKGQILIDGIDIKKIKIASLRKHFGQMLQDVFLFSGDIRSNIVLRKDDVTDEEVWQACKYVNADSFISKLEKGLDEPVRERGNNFSAGQRQLLSFARTILHKPSVMILDEATANIDTETEILIQDSLEKMKNIGTMLIVAHRLSTIQHADNIILLSHGQIIEQGNHQELLKLKGRYHQLYTLQFTKQQLQNS
ncbi:MAG: ABC transporter ATP-binding protein [Oscillospiraceae bacterium]|nr:ABC transporter ATP-binding protein [Oscillospiraceae bacterium]